jgi:hypothetical protein
MSMSRSKKPLLETIEEEPIRSRWFWGWGWGWRVISCWRPKVLKFGWYVGL